MTLRFLLPPSLGAVRAKARGELLERSLTTEMGEPVKVDVASDYAGIARVTKDGGADLVWAPAAVCARLEDEAHAIYKVVRGGRSSYRSALVARTEAHITIDRLPGKRAAWVDRLSLGGYLLVAHHLRERGVDPASTFASQAFLGTHPAVLSAVLEGRADVAAVAVTGPNTDEVESAISLHAGRAAALHLSAVTVTRSAPTDALVFTRALEPEQAQALIARLFTSAHPRSAALCLAMEAEGFERARAGEYSALRSLID